MATLVKQRPFRKRKNNSLVKQIKKVKLIYPSINVSIKWLWIFVLFVVFSYGIFFIIKNTIFKAENYIEKITYSRVSIDNYDEPTLYKKISDIIKHENYYVISKLRKGDIKRAIQQDFPIVRNIKIIQPDKYTASVHLDFYEPEIVIKLGDRKFGILGYYDFEIFSGNNIDNGIFSIELPQYISGVSSLHGLFFETSPEEFIYDMYVISEGIPNYSRIIYLPGSSMTVVFLENDKRIYFNNKNSLTGQIDNYNLLMKYYNKANTLKSIDLGSLDGDKIIVRK